MDKYWTFYRISFCHAIKNYKALFGLSIFLIACLLIFAHLWKVAAAKKGLVSFDPNQLLWYIAFNEWILIAIPDVHSDMEHDLRSGRLAYHLPRPISYLGAIFFEGAGRLTANLIILGIICFGFTWLKIGFLPFSMSAFILSLLFGVASGIVGLIFHMAIGLSAFWLKDITPFTWIWEKFLYLLGGLILPLSVYPLWIQKVALFTPFPSILGARSALTLGFSWHLAFNLALHLLFWGLFATTISMVAYRKGVKIVHIEGG
ncbi:MAG: hypothetical protein P0S95_05320 [Rhabdochlamydiaceae bacterium]|nr:hypothetical protein [Candidatus Amphrikana amoebophyrae]